MTKMMHAILLAGACFFGSIEATEPQKFTVHERVFTFSTYYDIDSDSGSWGQVIKNKVSLRTNYQYFDTAGKLGTAAYLRILSLGSAFTWAGVLDIYDPQDKIIGRVEGSYATFCPAKFDFYDELNNHVAIAYMDEHRMGVTIVAPDNMAKKIASFNRVFVPYHPDHWTVTIYDMEAIDPRFLAMFGAFMIDNHGEFKEDN